MAVRWLNSSAWNIHVSLESFTSKLNVILCFYLFPYLYNSIVLYIHTCMQVCYNGTALQCSVFYRSWLYSVQYCTAPILTILHCTILDCTILYRSWLYSVQHLAFQFFLNLYTVLYCTAQLVLYKVQRRIFGASERDLSIHTYIVKPPWWGKCAFAGGIGYWEEAWWHFIVV